MTPKQADKLALAMTLMADGERRERVRYGFADDPRFAISSGFSSGLYRAARLVREAMQRYPAAEYRDAYESCDRIPSL